MMDDSFEFEDENKTIICKIQGEECVLVSGPAEQIVFAKITDPEKIRYIWFPSTLCLVSETDFGACTNLETIIADQTLEGWCSILFEFVRWDNYDLILTDGKTVKTALIPEGITETSETFYGCASIERVVFPKGFRTIGADCFYNCRNLKSAILPDTLKEIKSSAFENCVSLKAIDIPKSVNIESCVFAGCDNLARVGLPAKAPTEGEFCFSGCKKIRTVHYKGKIENWSKYGFFNHQYFGVTNESHFDPVRSDEFLPYNLYVGGKLVKRAVIDGVGKIYNSGFAHCGSIRSVVIGDKVKTVEEDAFYATRIRRVTVGKNLKRIDDGAFDRCPEMKTVYYRGSKEEWKKIRIGVRNDALLNARIVYNYKDGGQTQT